MSRLARFTQKLFGSTAGTDQIAEYGSLAAGSPQRYSGATITPAIVQALGNYLQGWNAAVVGLKSPAIEDMNALCYLFGYQLAYNMQAGIPEWDAGTTYYIGSIAQDGAGNIYSSKTDNNLNNALSSSANWQLMVSSGSPQFSSQINYVTTSSSFADMTNATVTLKTTGRPVEIKLVGSGVVTSYIQMIQSAAASNTGGQAFVRLVIDGSTANTIEWLVGFPSSSSANQYTLPPSVVQFIDPSPTAGNHTYKLQAAVSNGGVGGAMTLTFGDQKLCAYEI